LSSSKLQKFFIEYVLINYVIGGLRVDVKKLFGRLTNPKRRGSLDMDKVLPIPSYDLSDSASRAKLGSHFTFVNREAQATLLIKHIEQEYNHFVDGTVNFELSCHPGPPGE